MINSSPACRGESVVLLTVHTGQLDVRWKVWRKENWRFYSTHEIGRPAIIVSRVFYARAPPNRCRASHHTPEFTHFSVSDVCECCNQFGRQGAKIAHLAAVSFLRVISAQFAEGIHWNDSVSPYNIADSGSFLCSAWKVKLGARCENMPLQTNHVFFYMQI